jgi:hypothetical protein
MEVINGAGVEFTDVEVPGVTDADVNFESVEDTEEAEVDDDDVDVDVEVVVKGRLRTAAPVSMLRDVPLDAQAVVFAGPHHHDARPAVEPLSGQAQGETESWKESVSTLGVSSIYMQETGTGLEAEDRNFLQFAQLSGSVKGRVSNVNVLRKVLSLTIVITVFYTASTPLIGTYASIY